ncbi:MAG TPA: SDR family oxidoreductase [Ignavibacteria bacterium]|nr:SDR family oxidoreductase [Ignavibacteria bacterium]HMR40357.1 SDR family oxidoreductase [Ignavibacteria bacterium]
MKVLITGGSGLLGQYLNRVLSESNTILTLYNSNSGNCTDYNSLKIDLTDQKKLRSLVSEYRPNVIFHTAAISRPELCDSLPENHVIDININSTRALAELCDSYNAKLIYTSTDLVYSGDRIRSAAEDEELAPVSFYAETKVRSEKEIRDVFDNYVILRTSLLYGLGFNHSVNNFQMMFENFRNGKPVKLFYDQFRTPLELNDAAELSAKLLTPEIKDITLNFGGFQRVSRSELGEMLCEIAGFQNSLIIRTPMNDIPGLHIVRDVSMNTDKLNSLGIKQKSIEESLRYILDSFRE